MLCSAGPMWFQIKEMFSKFCDAGVDFSAVRFHKVTFLCCNHSWKQRSDGHDVSSDYNGKCFCPAGWGSRSVSVSDPPFGCTGYRDLLRHARASIVSVHDILMTVLWSFIAKKSKRADAPIVSVARKMSHKEDKLCFHTVVFRTGNLGAVSMHVHPLSVLRFLGWAMIMRC